ncbi:hypothetical protein ABK046_46460, partial [Streptomyces caeruleatus]
TRTLLHLVNYYPPMGWFNSSKAPRMIEVEHWMQSALVTTNCCHLLTYTTLGSQIIDCYAGNQAYIVHHRSTRLQRGELGDILMKNCFD